MCRLRGNLLRGWPARNGAVDGNLLRLWRRAAEDVGRQNATRFRRTRSSGNSGTAPAGSLHPATLGALAAVNARPNARPGVASPDQGAGGRSLVDREIANYASDWQGDCRSTRRLAAEQR
jgi:hypothetical protein